jgi:O-antigen/teichoic acid export membrane protein
MPSIRERVAARVAGVGGRPGEASTATGRRVASQATLQLVVRTLNVGVGVVSIALLARSLGTSDFGVWVTALAYVGLFSWLTDFGFAQVGIQRMAAEPEREAEWLGALLAMRTVGAVVALAICVGGIPLFLDDGTEIRTVTLVLSLTVITGVPLALRAVFNSRMRAGVNLVLITLQSATWLAAVIAVDSAGGGLVDFAWAFVAVAVLASIIQIVVTRRLAVIALRAGRRLWGPLLRVAVPLGIAGILVTVYYRIDAVLLFNLRGAEEAGIYGAAYRILDPLHILPTAVMSAVFPVLASWYGRDHERVRRLAQAAIDYLAMVSLPIFAGSLVVGGPLMEAIFGGGFERSADVLPWLMLAFVSVCFGYVGGYLTPIVELQWWFAGFAAVGVVLNVALSLVLIPPHGAVGAAVATVITEFSVMTLTLIAVFRRLQFRPRFGRVVRTALATVPMALAAWWAADLGLLPALAVALPVYALALHLVRAITAAEVRGLLRREPVSQG